jgi:hypothetical protein
MKIFCKRFNIDNEYFGEYLKFGSLSAANRLRRGIIGVKNRISLCPTRLQKNK